MMQPLGLVADIGGTNARFALVPIHAGASKQVSLLEIRVFAVSEFATIEQAIAHYFKCLPPDYKQPKHAVLAVASPLMGDIVDMTNSHWRFSQSALKDHFSLQSLHIINDFISLAYSVQLLDQSQYIEVGVGKRHATAPVIVTGPGTGLGLAAVVNHGPECQVLETESGHIHFAPTNQTEVAILQHIAKHFDRVSYERILSGAGMENLYTAITAIHGHPQTLAAKDITYQAVNQQEPYCLETLSHFCRIFGSFCGDMALAYNAKGGVYLAGGIIATFASFFLKSEFRQCFEQKGRMSVLLKDIPIYLITEKQPGLLGAGCFLNLNCNS